MKVQLRELYQEVILDHNKNPRNQHVMKDATNKAEGFNPLCGDRMRIFLKLVDNKIADISFESCGCAISRASASLMTEIMRNKSIEESHGLFQKFHAAMTKDNVDLIPTDKLAVLSGVRAFPARVKCATLAWHTFEAAIKGQLNPVTTE